MFFVGETDGAENIHLKINTGNQNAVKFSTSSDRFKVWIIYRILKCLFEFGFSQLRFDFWTAQSSNFDRFVTAL